MEDALHIDHFAEEFKAGELLFEEGDEGSKMYVVQSGVIEISRIIGAERRVLAQLPAGEFFGEMALLNDRPRSATATALEDSRLLVIDGETLEAMLRGRPEIAVRLIKTIAGRLERANQQIELLLLKDGTHRVVQCLRQLAEEHGREGEGAVFLKVGTDEIGERTALSREELLDILQRLALARLVVYAEEAGIEEEGFVVPEVGRLLEFLEFLELKDRYGTVEDM